MHQQPRGISTCAVPAHVVHDEQWIVGWLQYDLESVEDDLLRYRLPGCLAPLNAQVDQFDALILHEAHAVTTSDATDN